MPVVDLQDRIKGLNSKEMTELIIGFAKNDAKERNKLLRRFSVETINEKLLENGVIPTCTSCGEDNKYNLSKNGVRSNGLQTFKCKTCNTQFTLFSDTIFEKTRYHWDIWVKVLQMTLVYTPLETMREILIKDYGATSINIKTVWLMRIKLAYAISKLPLPKLTGVIQLDETHVYESQKGKTKLINFLSKDDPRLPRHGHRPSKYGPMGAEFTTIVAAIDDRGYSINKAISYGRFSDELFHEEFTEHFHSPSYICSDLNLVYQKYCQDRALAHYIRPSNYVKILEEHGYVTKNRIDYSNPTRAKEIEEKNERIRQRLYKEELIDYINPQRLTYGDFNNIKRQHNLNLSRVNSLHDDIKHFLNRDMKNVSAKYINYYLGVFTFMKNFRVEHGRTPASIEDAENILIEIVKSKVTITKKELDEMDFTLERPSYRASRILKEETEFAQDVTGNVFFKFDYQDRVYTLQTRKFLETLPLYQLKQIAKPLRIPNYSAAHMTAWNLARLIEKHPDVKKEIYIFMNNNKLKQVPDEDMKVLERFL